MIKNNIFKYNIVIIILVSLFTCSNAQDRKKTAQTGFQFLSVVSDARAAALAGAATTLDMNSSSLFFNPAGIADMKNLVDISASQTDFIADIKHNTFTLALNPEDGAYGTIGFSLQTVDYGDNFFGTIAVRNGADDYIDTGNLNPSATAIGMGYAKKISERFLVGAQVRWVEQDLGTVTVANTVQIPTEVSADFPEGIKDTTLLVEEDYSVSPFAYDFGTTYKTGFKSLVFGMSIRNFSTDVKYIQESFQLPFVFTIGIHMNIVDFIDEGNEMHSALFSVNSSHFRSREEDIQFGLEYKVMQILSLRGGYVSNKDLEGMTYGIGLSYQGFSFDYAYTPFGIFDKVSRMTIRFSY